MWPGGEGEYIVRIPYATAPGDSISGPVLRTFLALHGHPAILTAYPLSMDNLSRIHDTGAKAHAGAPRSPALTPVLPPELRAARGSRRRHAIIGAVVGAAAGLVVYVVDQHGCRSQNGIPCGLGSANELMILVGGGALGGALVGAALPHGP